MFKKKSLPLAMLFASLIAVTPVSAEVVDYDYDMSKSRWTYGGGYGYVTYTRLDGERKDKYGFDPSWITPDSEIKITFETEGDYEGCPADLVFQTWEGDLVESTAHDTVHITPSEYDETHAVYTYEDMTTAWTYPMNWIYSITVSDVGTNNLFVSQMTVTNVDIPDEEIPKLRGAVLYKDDVELDLSAYTTTAATETEVVTSIEDEENITVLSVNEEGMLINDEGVAVVTVAEEEYESVRQTNGYLIGIVIALGLIVVGIVVLAIIHFVNKYKKSFH